MTNLDAVTDVLKTSRIGVLVCFTTNEDPHSPVMLPRYESLSRSLEIPLFQLDAGDLSPAWLDRMQIYSVPTLMWVGAPRHSNEIWSRRLRCMGIVNERKLEHEFDVAVQSLEASPDGDGG